MPDKSVINGLDKDQEKTDDQPENYIDDAALSGDTIGFVVCNTAHNRY